MNWHRIRTIIKKDIREITSNPSVLLPMIMVPLLLCVFIPSFLLFLAFRLDLSMLTGVDLIQRLIPVYDIPAALSSVNEKASYIFLNYTFVPFFMIIPVMMASIIAANSVVGEKERKTLETLLYTPVTNREFLTAKLLSSFIPALLLAWVSFGLFFLVTNVMSLFLKGLFIVQAWIWLPSILLLAPSVSLLGLSVTLFVSLKSKSFMEAQQLSALVVLPLIALIGIQITGVVVFKPFYVVILSAVILLISYLAIGKLGPRFSREKIISTL